MYNDKKKFKMLFSKVFTKILIVIEITSVLH